SPRGMLTPPEALICQVCSCPNTAPAMIAIKRVKISFFMFVDFCDRICRYCLLPKAGGRTVCAAAPARDPSIELVIQPLHEVFSFLVADPFGMNRIGLILGRENILTSQVKVT